MIKSKNTMSLLATMVILSSCHTYDTSNSNTNHTVGPNFCNTFSDVEAVEKLNHSALKEKSACFSHSIAEAVDKGLVIQKAKWLERTYGKNFAKNYLLDVLAEGDEVTRIHMELARLYYLEKNWQASKNHLQMSGIESSALLNILDFHLGSSGADSTLLPYLFRETDINHSDIEHLASTNAFSIQMISDGNPNTLNGEPSISAAQDGSHIWLAWTDSGESESSLPDYYYWDIKSAYSSDGGLSWSYFDMDTLPNAVNRFHFDPMTIYDQVNNNIYAGGMVKGFAENNQPSADDALFVYRWDLNNDMVAGPYKQFMPAPDKGWLSVDENGYLYAAHYQGIEMSTDLGESFTTISNESYFAPHPRFNHENCLIITDMMKSSQCSPNGIVTQNQVFSSLGFFNQLNDFIPGNFRVNAFAQNVIASNNDVYAVYTDLKSTNSNDTTLYMTSSNDNGHNWSTPWRITTDINGDQIMPWIEIDSNDGIHLVYLDTRNVSQSDSNNVATFDLYYSYSNDLGLTWQETRVTPTSFTTPDLFWGDYFFSDYISMSVTDNHVLIAFPWAQELNQMHMYLASKEFKQADLIYFNGFEGSVNRHNKSRH